MSYITSGIKADIHFCHFLVYLFQILYNNDLEENRNFPFFFFLNITTKLLWQKE